MTTKLLFCCTTLALGLSACQSPATTQNSTQAQSQNQSKTQTLSSKPQTIQALTADAAALQDATLLEQHQNLLATPNTQSNQARLLRQKSQCIIEFTGQFDAAKVTEYWVFKNDQLLQNHTLYHATPNTATAQDQPQKQQFNPQDPEKYANFLALKQHFSQKALAQCQNFATVAVATP